jgi:hypothetical protein
MSTILFNANFHRVASQAVRDYMQKVLACQRDIDQGKMGNGIASLLEMAVGNMGSVLI